MDLTKLILLFYKEQQFIFGVCPCCGKIFQLTDCGIYFEGKRIRIDELDAILEKGQEIDREEAKLESLEEKVYDMQDQIETLKLEYEEKVKPIIERRFKTTGRRQALARVKNLNKVFTRKKIDPRDVRLIFDPIEFVAFKGLTEGDEVSSIAFVTKSPQNRLQEKSLNSISKTIKNGNYDFTLIRIQENGSVDYT